MYSLNVVLIQMPTRFLLTDKDKYSKKRIKWKQPVYPNQDTLDDSDTELHMHVAPMSDSYI